jgi:rubredoxin
MTDHERKEIEMKTWQCVVCGFVYDEAKGLPEEGIAAGTRWEDIPADWGCPDCGVAKADFEMVEVVAA